MLGALSGLLTEVQTTVQRAWQERDTWIFTQVLPSTHKVLWLSPSDLGKALHSLPCPRPRLRKPRYDPVGVENQQAPRVGLPAWYRWSPCRWAHSVFRCGELQSLGLRKMASSP